MYHRAPRSIRANNALQNNNHSNERDERGQRVIHPDNEYTNTISGLNSLAKLFCTGHYSSIIKHIDKDILYVSLPEARVSGALNRSICSNDINRLKYFLGKILESNSDDVKLDYKVHLFTLACDIKNEIVINIVKSIHFVNERLQRQELNFLNSIDSKDYISCLKHNKDSFLYLNKENTEYKQDQGQFFKFMQIIIKHEFNNFLNSSDLNSLNDFQNVNLQKVDYRDDYSNVHVEAKGVHFALTQHPNSNHKKFLIGLAKGDGKSIGCCGGCTVEFNLLQREGIEVYRTADFPESYPPGAYKPSPNIKPEWVKDYFSFKTVVTGIYKIPMEDNRVLQHSLTEKQEECNKLIEKTKHDLCVAQDLIRNSYEQELTTLNEKHQVQLLEQQKQLEIHYRQKIKQLEEQNNELKQELAQKNTSLESLNINNGIEQKQEEQSLLEEPDNKDKNGSDKSENTTQITEQATASSTRIFLSNEIQQLELQLKNGANYATIWRFINSKYGDTWPSQISEWFNNNKEFMTTEDTGMSLNDPYSIFEITTHTTPVEEEIITLGCERS